MIAAEVYLWGTRIGYVVQDNISSIPMFSYDKNFLKSQIELSPITMPLSEQIYSFPNLNNETFHSLPGLLADSLPDKFGTNLLERYLAEQGRSINDISSVERLLYIGSRGMGALEYRPAKEYEKIKDDTVNIDELVKLAADILQKRKNIHIKENSDTMKQIIKVGTSAGGAKAKAVIAWNKKTGDIRSGQVETGSGYEYWIIKFDGTSVEDTKADKRCYTRIEYAYYLMAKAAGIDMSECSIYKESGRFHFMTKRFDRIKETGEKIHMLSLGAIAHFDFNSPGSTSYEQAANVMYKLKLNQDEIEQLFMRMVFNVMARNQDDHVKNISFLMNRKGEWSLAPAYDITYAYIPNSIWTGKHQMSINGKTENLTKQDIIDCGRHMNISNMRIKNIIEKVETAIINWDKYAHRAELPKLIIKEKKKNFVML